MYIKEATKRWKVSTHYVLDCISDGRITGAFKQRDPKFNNNRLTWIIPDDHPKPLFNKKHSHPLEVRKTPVVDLTNAPLETKKDYIRKHSISLIFGQLKQITGLSHMEIRNIYDSFFR